MRLRVYHVRAEDPCVFQPTNIRHCEENAFACSPVNNLIDFKAEVRWLRIVAEWRDSGEYSLNELVFPPPACVE